MSKASIRYGIFKRVPVTRGSLEFGTKPNFEFALAPNYGTFHSRVAARRAFMEGWDPELKGTSDAHILIHYNAMARNLKYYKIAPLTNSKNKS